MSELETQVQPPQKKRQSSEITGMSAVVFVAIMFAIDFIGAAIAGNRNVTRGIFSASLYLAAATWGISKALPAGWLNLKRTALLSLVLFGSVVAFILHAFDPILHLIGF